MLWAPVSSHMSRTKSGIINTLHLHSYPISESHFLFCSFGAVLKVGQFQTSLLLVSFHRHPAGRLCSQEAFHSLIFIRKTFLQWWIQINRSVRVSAVQLIPATDLSQFIEASTDVRLKDMCKIASLHKHQTDSTTAQWWKRELA